MGQGTNWSVLACALGWLGSEVWWASRCTEQIGTILPGQSKLIVFNWPDTPNPVDYPAGDGHFCLLAFITKAASPQFEGFEGPDLNENVLRFSKVAWRNIHIVPVAKLKMGNLVSLWARVAF